jgi:quercetin dioxygenase-like cupin family protein
MLAKFAAGIACLCAGTLLAGSAFGQTSALAPARLTGDELQWQAQANGNQRANLAGDDKKAGLYAYRVKFPPNFRNQPHFHPDDRIVTVMSGTLYVGFGEQFNEAALKPLAAGSIWTEPMKQPHFVWAKEGEVVIQVVGHGPSGVTLVPPAK